MSNIICPFCGQEDFDLIGLKDHFRKGYCDIYNNTISPQEESIIGKTGLNTIQQLEVEGADKILDPNSPFFEESIRLTIDAIKPEPYVKKSYYKGILI
jgi:hypothetical protein